MWYRMLYPLLSEDRQGCSAGFLWLRMCLSGNGSRGCLIRCKIGGTPLLLARRQSL